MIIKWILIQFILSIIPYAVATCYSDETCIYEELFVTNGYNRRVRPTLRATEPLVVNAAIVIRAVGGIDEKTEVMTLIGYLLLEWQDIFLRWDSNPDYSNVSSLVILAEDVWLPDVAIVNSADTYYKSTYKEDFRVVVESDGTVIWEFGGVMKTSCALDISNYPFDRQVCNVEVQNWAYTDVLVDLQPSVFPFLAMNFEHHALWKVTKLTHKRSLIGSIAATYPRVTFQFHLRRKTLYYLFNLIAPIILISVITLAMFWVPPGCGEKLGLGITVLLAFSVFQIIIMDNTPVNSDQTPKISQLVIFVMSMATISVLSSMLTVTLDLHSANSRLPKVLRIIAFKILARVFFLTSEIPHNPDCNDISPMVSEIDLQIEKKVDMKKEQEPGDSEKQLEDIVNELRTITSYIKEKEMAEGIVYEWKLFAKIMDRLLFWMSLSVFVIYFIHITNETMKDT